MSVGQLKINSFHKFVDKVYSFFEIDETTECDFKFKNVNIRIFHDLIKNTM